MARHMNEPEIIRYELSRTCPYCGAVITVSRSTSTAARMNLDSAWMAHMDYYHQAEMKETEDDAV